MPGIACLILYITAQIYTKFSEHNIMTINCVWEHNGNDTLLYAVNCIGAYTRGENLEVAKAKMPGEIVSYLKWLGEDTADNIEIMTSAGRAVSPGLSVSVRT